MFSLGHWNGNKNCKSTVECPKSKTLQELFTVTKKQKKNQNNEADIDANIRNTDSDLEVNDDVLDPTDYMDDADDESVDTEL